MTPHIEIDEKKYIMMEHLESQLNEKIIHSRKTGFIFI